MGRSLLVSRRGPLGTMTSRYDAQGFRFTEPNRTIGISRTYFYTLASSHLPQQLGEKAYTTVAKVFKSPYVQHVEVGPRHLAIVVTFLSSKSRREFEKKIALFIRDTYRVPPDQVLLEVRRRDLPNDYRMVV
jgi:hypothetical protein